MSANNRQFIEALTRLSNSFGVDIPVIVLATVKSVDEENRTCVCVPVNDKSVAEIPDVLISAIDNDGELAFPEVDSVVVICRTTKNQPFILKASDLQKYILYATLIQFNDGAFGGLAKVEALTEKLNNLEVRVNDFLTTLAGITIPLAPSGTYPFAPLFASYQPLTPTEQTEIENPDVTHGSSN